MKSSELSWDMRARVVEFLILSAQKLEVPPMVKYSALSLFADRFYATISSKGKQPRNWLLQPMRESNLQLFALVSIWISNKIHDSRTISVKSLKSLGDKIIKDQHFTTRDFLEAEVILLEALDFEIGTTNIAFMFLEDLLVQLKGVARVGELVNFEACMDIMDLLYEKEETSILFSSPILLSASILVASYVMTVPKQRWEFPVLPWGLDTLAKRNAGNALSNNILVNPTLSSLILPYNFDIDHRPYQILAVVGRLLVCHLEDDILENVRDILHHIFLKPEDSSEK